MTRFAASLIVLLGLLLPSLHADNFAARIDAVIGAPETQQGRWGILVVDAKTGKTLYQVNADQGFMPASAIKLYYAAAALAAPGLGPDFRFETPVYARGTITEGRLRGDLILVGQGDLTLGGRNDRRGHMAYTADDHSYANATGADSQLTDADPLAGLKSLAKQVAQAGIRRVDGDVLIDDRLFPPTRNNGNGPEWLSPIVVNDNLMDLTIRPGSLSGEAARVELRPETAFLRVEVEVVTVPPGRTAWVDVLERGTRRVLLRGQVPVGSRPLLRTASIQEPAAFARALFIETLRREGVEVGAPAEQAALPSPEAYEKLPRVALFISPPFSELVKVTLKTSSNLYANTFPLLIAVRNGKRALTEGLPLQRRILTDLGVDLHGVSLATASGGTDEDSVTPRATVQLLQALARRPEFPVLRDALPLLGVDGTLADMVPPDSRARGKVQAKTGTFFLPETRTRFPFVRSKALAGTMTTADERTLYFAIFVNDLPLPSGGTSDQVGRLLGRLCEVFYVSRP